MFKIQAPPLVLRFIRGTYYRFRMRVELQNTPHVITLGLWN